MDEPPVSGTGLAQVHKTLSTLEQYVALLIAEQPAVAPPTVGRVPRLGPAQRRFLELLCHPDEYTYDQIAAEMGISTNSVHTHRKRLFVRFRVRSKAGLVKLAHTWGIGTR
jgi:DNA-binding CsgD family transcriptional regulator